MCSLISLKSTYTCTLPAPCSFCLLYILVHTSYSIFVRFSVKLCLNAQCFDSHQMMNYREENVATPECCSFDLPSHLFARLNRFRFPILSGNISIKPKKQLI